MKPFFSRYMQPPPPQKKKKKTAQLVPSWTFGVFLCVLSNALTALGLVTQKWPGFCEVFRGGFLGFGV